MVSKYNASKIPIIIFIYWYFYLPPVEANIQPNEMYDDNKPELKWKRKVNSMLLIEKILRCSTTCYDNKSNHQI